MHLDGIPFPLLRDRSIVVFTSVDGALREFDAGSCTAAKTALEALVGRGIPIVFTSHHDPGELIAIQQELGLREPFIAGAGRSLHIPRGYFMRLPHFGGQLQEWEVLELDPPSIEQAVESLMWFYRVSGDSPLLVGIGIFPTDRSLLGHVDVPVVIRSAVFDHGQLTAEFPQAFVTKAAGPSGWTEAILGDGMQDGAGDDESG